MTRFAALYLCRAAAVAALAVWLGAGAMAQTPSRADFKEALGLARTGQWDKLAPLRAKLTDPVARDVIDWHRLRAARGSLADCTDFVTRNPDWPGMPLLRQSCEGKIAFGAGGEDMLRYYDGQDPRTGLGALRLAEKLSQMDRDDDADALLRRAWVTLKLNPSDRQLFLDGHRALLKDLHTERLDMLLWQGDDDAAKAMFPLVSESWRKLAKARIGLRDMVGNVDTLIENLPDDMAEDSGLAYERFLWRVRKDRLASAIDILLERSISKLDLGAPDIWAQRRNYLAREMMSEGKYTLAYEIASSHFLQDGSTYADLEWLSGYLALRQLKSPAQAVAHFTNFRAAVRTPISLGRAGYWLGLAQEAAGNDAAAAEAFAFGAKYQSSFYGQLSAETAGLPAPSAMTGVEDFDDWRKAPFVTSRVLEAAMQLYIVGSYDLSERFLLHLAETQSRTGIGQLGQLAFELKNPHIALMLAKQGAKQGHEIWESYFPVTTPAGLDLPIAPEIALSIARRESEFNPVVASSAGARGLMQLMPGTAKEIAGRIGEPYAPNRLLTDPDYNARIGGAYLAELSKRYDGNLLLMSAAYNAGPSRVTKWIDTLGDPRSPDVDPVDWIENIPFRETRNYVMRVTESIAPYRARLSGKVEPPALTQLLRR